MSSSTESPPRNRPAGEWRLTAAGRLQVLDREMWPAPTTGTGIARVSGERRRRYNVRDVCTSCWYDSCESCRNAACACRVHNHPNSPIKPPGGPRRTEVK